MIEIAICCNDFNHINILKGHIYKFSKTNNIRFRINIFNSIEEIEKAPGNNFNILFYFINLDNKIDIFSINKRLSSLNNTTQIIYIPNFIDFVVNGLYLNDFRVLLKVLDYSSFHDEFKIYIDDCRDIYDSNPMSIHFISSLNDRCVAYTINDTYLIPMSIDDLHKKLDSSIFFKCNDKCIINLHQIKKITRDYVIINDKTIHVDKDKFDNLKNKLLNILRL